MFAFDSPCLFFFESPQTRHFPKSSGLLGASIYSTFRLGIPVQRPSVRTSTSVRREDVYMADALVSQVEEAVGRKKKIGFGLIIEATMGASDEGMAGYTGRQGWSHVV